MKGTQNTLAIMLGVVIGFMLGIWGFNQVHRSYGFQVDVPNPIGWIPFQSSTIPAGISIENLGWMIFLPILILIILADMMGYFLILFFKPGLVITYSLFVLFHLLVFAMTFWMGLIIRGWI